MKRKLHFHSESVTLTYRIYKEPPAGHGATSPASHGISLEAHAFSMACMYTVTT